MNRFTWPGAARLHDAMKGLENFLGSIRRVFDAGATGKRGYAFDDSFLELEELSADPAAPGANRARLYVKDNGAGKTTLVVRFPTGAVQTISTEP